MKKISTLEEVGNLLQEHIHEERENAKSIGEHFVTIENRLEDLADLMKLRERVERMAANIREKLHIEV